MGQKKREAGHPHHGIALRAISPVAIIATEPQHPAAVSCKYNEDKIMNDEPNENTDMNATQAHYTIKPRSRNK